MWYGIIGDGYSVVVEGRDASRMAVEVTRALGVGQHSEHDEEETKRK